MSVAMLAALVLVISAVATTDGAARRNHDEKESTREYSNKEKVDKKHLKHSRRFLNRHPIQQYPGVINSPMTHLDLVLQQLPGQLNGPFSKFKNRVLCQTDTDCSRLICDELTHPACYYSIILGQYCACLNKPVTTPDKDHIKNYLPIKTVAQDDQNKSEQRKEDYRNILDQLKIIQKNQIILNEVKPQQCQCSVVCKKCKQCPSCTPENVNSTDGDKKSYEYYYEYYYDDEQPSNHSNTENTEKLSKKDSSILSEESFDPYISDVKMRPIYVLSNTTDHKIREKTYQTNTSHIPINSSNVDDAYIRFIRNRGKGKRLSSLRKNENILYSRQKPLNLPFMMYNQNLTYAGNPFVDDYLYHIKNKLRHYSKLRQRYNFNEPKNIHDTENVHKNESEPRQPHRNDLKRLKDHRNFFLNPNTDEVSTEIFGPKPATATSGNPFIKLILYQPNKFRNNHDDRKQYNLLKLLKKYYSIDDSKRANFHDPTDNSKIRRKLYHKLRTLIHQLHNPKIISKIYGPYYDSHDLEEDIPFTINRIYPDKKKYYPHVIDYVRDKIYHIQNPESNIRKRINFLNSFYNTDRESAIKDIINNHTNKQINKSNLKDEFIQFLKDNGYYFENMPNNENSNNDLDDSSTSRTIKHTKITNPEKNVPKKQNNESLLLESVDSRSPENEYDNDDSNLIDASYDTSEDEPSLIGSKNYLSPSLTTKQGLHYYNLLTKDKNTGVVEKQIERSGSNSHIIATQQLVKKRENLIDSHQNISKNLTFDDNLEVSTKRRKAPQQGNSKSKNNKTENVVVPALRVTSKSKSNLRTDTLSKDKLPVKPVTTNIKIRIKSK